MLDPKNNSPQSSRIISGSSRLYKLLTMHITTCCQSSFIRIAPHTHAYPPTTGTAIRMSVNPAKLAMTLNRTDTQLLPLLLLLLLCVLAECVKIPSTARHVGM